MNKSILFEKEKDFEETLIKFLKKECAWDGGVLKYPTEQDLLDNWARIIYQRNCDPDVLGDYRLTDGEMDQIIAQVESLRTPYKLNGLINGKTVTIRRDNEQDERHFGQDVSLVIFDEPTKKEDGNGKRGNIYQIAQQPYFESLNPTVGEKRGDLMLLINGMPLIHVELKRTGVDVSEAWRQIELYSHNGVFAHGIYALIQVFVAMTPEETLYFANPGPDGEFDSNYFFHWGDFDNEPVNEWSEVARDLLIIPMAHELISLFCVADERDEKLKVMRSYQIWAVRKIFHSLEDKQKKSDIHGGYIYHTTGSGKTMTSFKAAQFVANAKLADKVVFLADRSELEIQSATEHKAFADETDTINETKSAKGLLRLLSKDDPTKVLIETSIQKMGQIHPGESCYNPSLVAAANEKRIVIIVDECHRSVFGDFLLHIKNTFTNAILFGFTGTPIIDENMKKHCTTSDIFGDELHHYPIADGIRDKNVLEFYPVMMTYDDNEIRREYAKRKIGFKDESEIQQDEKKLKAYFDIMSMPMADEKGPDGHIIHGVEYYIPNSQYEDEKHHRRVLEDIKKNWFMLSRNGMFHAILTTESIEEAISYYRLSKEILPNLKVTALFDPSLDNNNRTIDKSDAVVEMLNDYYEHFAKRFTLKNYAGFKKDVSFRLAHKKYYQSIGEDKQQQLDILIVVDQMLTGFDSKWVNTLYIDRMLEKEHLIQAFSRTNRLFGPEKPLGAIRYYRRPHTMKQNIDEAFRMYSWDKPYRVFVSHLSQNVLAMNSLYLEIQALFVNDGILNYERLPESKVTCGMFAKKFSQLNKHIETAKMQGFKWDVDEYSDNNGQSVIRNFDYKTFLILLTRYKEMFSGRGGNGGGGGNSPDFPFVLDSHLMAIETENIDLQYMNERFTKYLKLQQLDPTNREAIEKLEFELHQSFNTLTRDQQNHANKIMHDIKSGDFVYQEGLTLNDYISRDMSDARDFQVQIVVDAIGVDKGKLLEFLVLPTTEDNINELGRFNALKETADKQKAKAYFDVVEKEDLPMRKVNRMIHEFLQRFILSDEEKERIAKEYLAIHPELKRTVVNIDGETEVHSPSVIMYSFQESEEPFLAMVADSSDIAKLPEEARLDILRKSVIAVIALEDFKGKKLFTRKEQWEAIYRSAVDNYLALEGDYAYFVTCLKRMNIADLPFPCTVELLEKNDVGVFQMPVEEWTVEQYHELNKPRSDKKFHDLLLVAERFKKIVLNNVPKVKVDVKATKDSSGVNIQIQDSAVKIDNHYAKDSVHLGAGSTLNGDVIVEQ